MPSSSGGRWLPGDVVPPLGTTGMAIEQETAGLHHSVDSFVVGRDRLDLGHELLVR